MSKLNFDMYSTALSLQLQWNWFFFSWERTGDFVIAIIRIFLERWIHFRWTKFQIRQFHHCLLNKIIFPPKFFFQNVTSILTLNSFIMVCCKHYRHKIHHINLTAPSLTKEKTLLKCVLYKKYLREVDNNMGLSIFSDMWLV